MEGGSRLHTHFDETPFATRAYAAACVPFRWMLAEGAPDTAHRVELLATGPCDPSARPRLGPPAAGDAGRS